MLARTGIVALLIASSARFAVAQTDAASEEAASQAPAPPSDLDVRDRAWDNGESITVSFALSPDDTSPESGIQYLVEISGEYGGLYREATGRIVPEEADYRRGRVIAYADKLVTGEPYWFRVYAISPDGAKSEMVETAADDPKRPTREWFDGSRFWLGVISAIVCGSVVLFIYLARLGRPLYIRKIAGLEAVEEAVGRATEMGRPCLFIPGIQDMNDIQTIAGLTVLSRVAQRSAEFDAKLEVPTSKSLVMTAARETVASAFLAAGRPDAYNEDSIYYVTDEQFGYVAYLSGHMVREKPAACFYMGSFFAESLILAETGNAVGAIQVAGTAQPAQLPFFVAACDYTLIGEEFFAASAYLSHDPDQLGSLKGQDVGKIVVVVLLVVGVGLVTMSELTGSPAWQTAADYLRDTILSTGS